MVLESVVFTDEREPVDVYWPGWIVTAFRAPRVDGAHVLPEKDNVLEASGPLGAHVRVVVPYSGLSLNEGAEMRCALAMLFASVTELAAKRRRGGKFI